MFIKKKKENNEICDNFTAYDGTNFNSGVSYLNIELKYKLFEMLKVS